MLLQSDDMHNTAFAYGCLPYTIWIHWLWNRNLCPAQFFEILLPLPQIEEGWGM